MIPNVLGWVLDFWISLPPKILHMRQLIDDPFPFLLKSPSKCDLCIRVVNICGTGVGGGGGGGGVAASECGN